MSDYFDNDIQREDFDADVRERRFQDEDERRADKDTTEVVYLGHEKDQVDVDLYKKDNAN